MLVFHTHLSTPYAEPKLGRPEPSYQEWKKYVAPPRRQGLLVGEKLLLTSAVRR